MRGFLLVAKSEKLSYIQQQIEGEILAEKPSITARFEIISPGLFFMLSS